MQNYSCTDLPQTSYQVGAFATYQERQINPNQKDISFFNITKTISNFVEGFVKATNLTSYFPFNATCVTASYNNFHELRLNFTANPISGLNKCSGIFNFFNQNYPYLAPTIYLGGPSLATGDYNYTLCEGGRYGEVSV